LWGQFLPAFGLLLLVWLYLSNISLFRHADFGSIIFYASTFCSLPIIGLHFSLRCRTFMTALLATLCADFVMPIVAGSIIAVWWTPFVRTAGAWIYGSVLSVSGTVWAFALVQTVIAAVCWNKVLTRLKKRSFPLERATV
jgi:hypothetical protein